MSATQAVPTGTDPLPARTAALEVRSRATRLAERRAISLPRREALRPSAAYWKAEAAALRDWRRPLSASPLVISRDTQAAIAEKRAAGDEAEAARTELKAERMLTWIVVPSAGVDEGEVPGPEVLVDDDAYWEEEGRLWERWIEEQQAGGEDGGENSERRRVESGAEDVGTELPMRECGEVLH